MYTNTDWSDAVAAESALGLNLVLNTSISSWKSTQDGAYDWSTGTWVTLDSGGWVAASEEIISYYLDPRNYLDVTHIFTFLDYTYDSDKQTKAGLTTLVSGTFLAGTYTESDTEYSYISQIMKAAQKTNMNPYLIATMILQEQGSDGSGKLISGAVSGYEGLYNFFSVGAYATSSMTAVQRGLWYASGGSSGATTYSRPWNTRYSSILGGAQWYVASYISQNQNTIYTKKFNVFGSSTYSAYTHQYMTNVGGAYSEGATLAKAYDETAREEALVFEIPVFDNMPDEAAVMPTTDGSPNTQLASLSVTGYDLTPSFSTNITSYDVLVDSGTTKVKVKATAVDDTATVTGTGTIKLGSGVTTVTVVVTAQNGSTRTYEINIGYAESTTESEQDYLDTAYTISDSILSGLTSVPMTTKKLISGLGLADGYSAVLTDGTDARANSDYVCTGDVLQIYCDGALVETFTVVIYGDVNADGKISVADIIKILKHILGMKSLSTIGKSAADTNQDGKVSVADILKIQKHILGITTLTQW